MLGVSSVVLAKGALANPALPSPTAQPMAQERVDASIAAASRSTPPARSQGSAQSVAGGEDALIQQMTGRSVARPVQPAQPSAPKFTPLSPSAPPVAAKTAQPTQTAPVLVTVGTNSDATLPLLGPARSRPCVASCYQSSPVAQSGVTPLPSVEPATPLPATPPSGGTINTQPLESAPAAGRITPNRPLNAASLTVQGVYLYQGDESSARARLTAVYPLTPRLLFGAVIDLTDGNAFADSREQGLNVTELYLATSIADLPNLRLVVGQLDLTSYFDRNSFAKDAATHFFNPVFQTNPALSATGIASRPAALVNWAVTDNIEAKVAVFSSSRSVSSFALDGFAGELGIRYGNLIVRGTYVSDRDAGSRDGFREIFQIPRGDRTGPLRDDREESYGINAELFIPNLKMGIFGRYGHYDNLDLNRGGDTYSAGVNFLDVFSPSDRLGIAYGRGLSNDNLRRRSDDKVPDVLELFYDFRVLPNLRLGLMVQQRNDFSETIAGFRVRTEFEVTPLSRVIQ
ncbi:carbohydrate porin [Leptolyngbya sp. FACHB-36]|uniref:carbohydrate porin n=1 Tax=Leptolyngbya sp. FACHB-36 TaxID=2692808 RepID=UPI0018EFBF75